MYEVLNANDISDVTNFWGVINHDGTILLKIHYANAFLEELDAIFLVSQIAALQCRRLADIFSNLYK